MGFILAQGGSSLYKIDPSTGTATALSLPSGVTLSTTRKPRFAVLNQWIAMVNSPSQNLAIDPEGTVRVMVPRAPTASPNAIVGTGTGLTGGYKLKSSFLVKNSIDEVLMESALSPVSNTVSLANQALGASGAPISLDSISARRLYRNLAGGSVFYRWLDIDGNTGTTANSNLADASLELLPVAPSLIAPPGTLPGSRLKNIVSWKQRLWAIADDPALVDYIYGSDTDKVYSWPVRLTAYPTGQDSEGCIALAPRRDQLGVLKRDGLWQITGSSSGTGINASTLSIIQIAFGKAGCIAADSVVTVNDKVYWLGQDGVYEWGPEGVKNISEDRVHGWFTTDTYFNRSRFGSAFARYNKIRNQYELHLAAAGSSSEDRWVSFNLTNRKWYGPHRTAAFTPSHAGAATDANGLPVSLVGGTDGVIYVANQTTYRDGAATAIDFDCFGPFHHGDSPDIEHCFLELSVLSKVESGGTLTITPYVGRLDAAAGSVISHSLTTGRELLPRLGDGAMARLRFRQNDVNQGVALYGYELPFFENGRR